MVILTIGKGFGKMDSCMKRFTIGLPVSGITEHFIISICKGV